MSEQPSELWVVSDPKHENRWAYVDKEKAQKAKDGMEPCGFLEKCTIGKYVKDDKDA